MMKQVLPSSWFQSELKDLIEFAIGGDWGKDINLSLEGEYVRVQCLRGSEIKSWNKEKGSSASIRMIKKGSLDKRRLHIGDILLEISGGGPDQPVGRTVLIDDEVLNFQSELPKICSNFLRLLRLSKQVDSKYINYYLQFFYNTGEVVKYQAGSNNLRNLNFKEYIQISVPVAPLAEQKRIVGKLDEAFQHLEKLKARLERIPQLLKKFRETVLTQAVTGKLTEKWRDGCNLSCSMDEDRNNAYILHQLPKGWVHSLIGNVSTVKGGKRLPEGEELVPYKTEYPYIRARDLKRGTVLTNNLMYLLPKTREKIRNYIVRTGDVYITIVGAKIGDAGIIPEEMHGSNLTENAAKITDLNNVSANYLSLWLRSPICQTFIQNTIMSAAQGKLALTRIKLLPLYLPSMQEQTEITNKVDALLRVADKLEAKFVMFTAKIDALPQTLLTKAFKGELVPQHEDDELASVLLERIKTLNRHLSHENKKTVDIKV